LNGVTLEEFAFVPVFLVQLTDAAAGGDGKEGDVVTGRRIAPRTGMGRIDIVGQTEAAVFDRLAGEFEGFNDFVRSRTENVNLISFAGSLEKLPDGVNLHGALAADGLQLIDDFSQHNGFFIALFEQLFKAA